MSFPFPNKSLFDTGRFFQPTDKSRLEITSNEPKQVIFLDRDGVIIADEGHLIDAGRMKLLQGVPDALAQLSENYYLIVITNQSGVSRGLLSEDDLWSIHLELCFRLATYGVNLDGIYYCPHHPECGDTSFRIECRCRKPKPGMLLQASADWNIDMDRSFMVGDNLTDVEAARAAGVKPVLVGKSTDIDSKSLVGVADLSGAASHIMSRPGSAKTGIPGGID